MPTIAQARALQTIEVGIATVQQQIANLQKLLDTLEGRHESLVRQNCDLDGAHDRRAVAVR